MTRTARSILGLVVAGPAAIASTLLMAPLWRWLEATTSIESIGHSGPASWCYAAVFSVLVVVVLAWVGLRGSRS